MCGLADVPIWIHYRTRSESERDLVFSGYCNLWRRERSHFHSSAIVFNLASDGWFLNDEETVYEENNSDPQAIVNDIIYSIRAGADSGCLGGRGGKK